MSAVERFAQVIPLNLQEIFIWYFEQKGVDNPERFLSAGVNAGVNGFNQENNAVNLSSPNGRGQGEGANFSTQLMSDNIPENQLSQTPDLSQIPQGADMETILNLVKLVYKYACENGGKNSELEKLVENLEQITEE